MAKKTIPNRADPMGDYDPLTKCPLCGTYVAKSTMKPVFVGSIAVCVHCYNE